MAAVSRSRVLGLVLVLAVLATACGSRAEPVALSAPSPPPEARQGPATSTVGDVVDLPATVPSAPQAVDILPRFDATGPGWTRLPDSPLSPRQGVGLVAFGNEVLVIGGTDEVCQGFCVGPAAALTDGAALDMSSLTWRSLPDLPVDTLRSALVAIGDAVYASTPTGRVVRLRVADNEWDKLAGPTDRGALLTGVGGRLVASGGGGEGGSGWADYVLDASTDTWIQLPPDPLPRNEDRFVVDLNGDVGVFASRRPSQEKVGVAFDFDTWEWRELAPSNREGFQMWAVDGLGYLAAHGEGATGGIYNPTTDSWSPLPDPPPDPSWDPFLDGVVGAATSTFGAERPRWVLDAVAAKWVAVEPMPVSGGSTYGSTTSWGKAMFVFGGTRPIGEGNQQPQPVELLNEAWLWTSPVSTPMTGADESLFTLHVSNQSFDEPTVIIAAVLDGQLLIDQPFDVESQHSWSSFEVALAPGEHVLEFISDTGVESSAEFTTQPGEPLWAVLDYWFDPGEGGRFFNFETYDEPVGFD